MDLTPAILAEITFIEILILILLMSALAGRKPSQKDRLYSRDESLQEIVRAVKPKTLGVKAKKQEEKIAGNIFKENIFVLVLLVLVAVGYAAYNYAKRTGNWITSISTSSVAIPLVIAIVIVVILVVIVYQVLHK